MGFPKGQFTYYPTHTMPVMLDVLWCLYPEQEAPERPGPKPRPALVRAVALYHQQQRVAVEVVFGTSKMSKLHQLDLKIANIEEMAIAGLPQNTGFRLSRSLWLPWCSEFFVPREGKRTPIIGRLGDRSQMQLEALKVMRRGKHFD